MTDERHVVTGMVIGYWFTRGEEAARRLSDHGVRAKCEVRMSEAGVGSDEHRLVSVIHFEMGTFGKILMAEMIADALDAESSEHGARKAAAGD